MMATVTEERGIAEDAPEQLPPLPPPSVREASGGQQSLGTITEEAEEEQQAPETVTKEAEKEPGKTGTRKKDKPSAEPVGLSPFSSDKLMGSRAFSTYC